MKIPDSEMLAWVLEKLVTYDGLELYQDGADETWVIYVGMIRLGSGDTPKDAVADAIRREKEGKR